MSIIVKIIGLLIASFLVLYGAAGIVIAANSGHPIVAAVSVLQAVICGGIAGFIFARIIGGQVSANIAHSIFLFSGNINPPPPEFAGIRAKIANGEYAEAEKELIAFLEKNNGNIHAVKLLAGLFIDKTRQYGKAAGLLKSYLSKEERTSDDLPFAMMLADVYLELGKNETAKEFLASELQKKYDALSFSSIRKRIEGIESKY
jgi:hypothetical protein